MKRTHQSNKDKKESKPLAKAHEEKPAELQKIAIPIEGHTYPSKHHIDRRNVTFNDHFILYYVKPNGTESFTEVYKAIDLDTMEEFQVDWQTAMHYFRKELDDYETSNKTAREGSLIHNSREAQAALIPHIDPYATTSDEEDDRKPAAKPRNEYKATIKMNNGRLSLPDSSTVILDSGCDTCSIGGEAWKIDYYTGQAVDVQGFHNNIGINNVPIGSGITAFDLPDNTTVLLKVNEASIIDGKTASLLSVIQLRDNQVIVEDNPTRNKFPFIEIDNCIIPFTFDKGLLTIKVRKPTQHELEHCDMIVLTSDEPWDPTKFHHDQILDNEEYSTFCNEYFDNETRHIYATWHKKKPYDAKKVAPYLLNPGPDIIQKTLQATTQLGKYSTRIPLRPHYKTRNPLLSKVKLYEPWSTDTWFFWITSYEGYNCCQLFTGNNSFHIFNYGMKSEHDGPEALLEFFRRIGVPISIRRDNSKMQTSQAWNDIMRRYNCDDEFIEPYNPQQNTAERRIGIIKNAMKRTFIDTGCSPQSWYRLAQHVIDVYNHTALRSLHWRTPIEVSLGTTPDISGLLLYKFWEPIYYYDPPTEGEKLGRWMGRADNYGDTMCHWILTDDTEELIVQGTVCSAIHTNQPNLLIDSGEVTREHTNIQENQENGNANPPNQQNQNQNNPQENNPQDPDSGELPNSNEAPPQEQESIENVDLTQAYNQFPIIEQEYLQENKAYNIPGLPITIYPQDLIDKIVYYGDKKAKIKEQINDDEYRVTYGKGKSGIMHYQELIQQLSGINDEENDHWEIEEFLDHRWGRGKMKNKIEILVKWKDEIDPTWEPMKIMKEDDPITLAKYAEDKDLLNKSMWKWAKRYILLQKTSQARIHQIYMMKKSKSVPKYKFGERVPRTIEEAYQIDKENGNSGWADAIAKEITCLKDKYNCFKILPNGTRVPKGYQIIKLLWTFDIKVDGRKRARLVAGGHTTEKLEFEEVTSSMVRLDTVKIAFMTPLLLGHVKPLMGDINSAYIQAMTKELIATIAGKEFGPSIHGKAMLIDKALYGLQASGKAWHSKFADDLFSLGFVPSKADPDLWIKDRGTHYDYIGVFVDDVLIFSDKPQVYFNLLKDKFHYEFKDIAEPQYYNGADFYTDPKTKRYCMSAKTYIKNVIEKIEKLLGKPLKNYGAPMVTDDHPEIDETDFMDTVGHKIYQMLIGCAQWAVTIGRFDIQYATNSLARFGACPREGHFKRALRIFGYLKHHPKYRVEFNDTYPDDSSLEFVDHDWQDKYPGYTDDTPEDMPPVLSKNAKEALITCYVDSSHACDLETRRSVTGILIFINSTPIKWYSKKQNTVETSTYGSELVAARIAVEQIMELRYKLRMLGFKVTQPARLLCDNLAVVTNTTLPSSSLKKKHNAIAYHKVREAVAAGIVKVAYIPSEWNLADILTKPLSPQDFYRLLYNVLFRPSQDDEVNQGELQQQAG